MGKKTVLLVEDDDAVGEMLREQLDRHGYVVERAATLPAAEQAFRDQRFDAVLLDGSLGYDHTRVDTTDFLRLVKRHGFRGRVIGISGSTASNCVLCLNGADVGIPKTRVAEILTALKR